MAVYFTHTVTSPLEQSKFVAVSWHSHYSLLAVVAERRSPDHGMVFFCHDEGEIIMDMCIEKPHLAEAICWHPDRKILAIGWSNGEIMTCNVHENEVYSMTLHHQNNVNIVRWSITGNHLISVDKSGLVLLWQVESKGELHSSPVHQTKAAGQVTHCVILLDSKSSTRTVTSGLASVLASNTGQLYLLNNDGHCVEVEHVYAPLSHLVYSTDTSFLAALTNDMSLIIFSTQNNSIHKYSEAKISGEGVVSSMIWTLPGVLATCSKEPDIRFWDTIENDNYTLSLRDYYQNDNETVANINYDNNNGLLLAVTTEGHALIWSRNEDKNQWNLINYINAEGPVDSISWGSGKHLLAICHEGSVKILKEHIVSSHYNEKVSAVQMTINSVVCQCHSTGATINLSTDIMINGLTVSSDHIALWDGTKVIIYSLSFNKETFNLIGSFNSTATSFIIYETNVYNIEEGELCIHSVVGVLKNRVSLDINEVGLVNLRLSGHYLVISVADGIIKMFDLKRREPVLLFSNTVSHHVPQFMNIKSAKANSDGNLIGFIVTKSSHKSVLVIMNIEKDSVKVLDFTTNGGKETAGTEEGGGEGGISSSLLPEGLPDNIMREQHKILSQLTGSDVIKFYWDTVDPRLLLIEVQRLIKRKKQKPTGGQDWERAVLTLFVTRDLCYLFQDIDPLKTQYHNIIGCTAPSVYCMRKNLTTPLSVDTTLGTKLLLPVERQPLRDFHGLEDCDTATVKAVLSFSYHSTMGNMDEAFKDVKSIKSKGVWETLAMMSVKTHRLDVALVCLGNMGNARGAKAVREAKSIKEEDAQLAVLAVHLGMIDTAEELYISSGRYDLLNQFYQSCGRWQKAVEVAEVNDRLHLKNTYYNLGKYSESIGEIKSAIKSYEQSGTHKFEVVRMLINEPDELLEYTVRSQDKEVQHYWAEHLECSGDLDGAIDQYRSCGDYRSVVRLLIFIGDTDGASKVVEETGDRAAAYHVARVLAQSEDWYQVKKAVQFYTLAQCYSHAITVTKDFGMETELMNLALLSTTEDKIEAAKYFEVKSDSKENAILLYHRAGELSKALELCFQYRQYDILQQISEELSEGTNPETVRRVAEYFIQQEQFEKAVQILLQSHKLSEALAMCLKHNVMINEELAEKLTPAQTDNETPEQSEERLRQLNALADGLVSQGSYHLAAMKYTQASNKIQAMKALLKSGDTERIVFFANVSRQKDIYVMAANYLQSLDWRSNPNIMKNIISFYTKGRALETLSNFYDTCAKVEIEEFQNYEKALGALNEAILVLEKCKSKNVTAIEEKKTFLKERLDLIKKFIDIRNLYADDPQYSIQQCTLLLDEPHIDTALRTGDVFAMIVSHYSYHGDHQQAYKYVTEMRRRLPGVNLSFFIKPETLDAISKALGTVLIIGGNEEEEEEEREGGESDESIEEVVD